MPNTENSQVVRIGRRSASGVKNRTSGLNTTTKPTNGPINRRSPILIDKFLAVAIAGTCFGMLWLGNKLWLIRAGIISTSASYYNCRKIHEVIQLYVFFSTAICGFIIQSVPSILGINQPLSIRIALWILFAPVIGVFVLILALYSNFNILPAQALIASAPLTTLTLFVVRQRAKVLRPDSLFLCISLLGFGLGAFFQLGSTSSGLLIWWMGAGGALLGVSHIFAANLLLAPTLSPKFLYLSLLLFCLSSILYLNYRFAFGALIGLILMVGYSLKSGIFLQLSGSPALRWGYRFGYFWGLVALSYLGLNPLAIDSALHILATGWGISILFPLSLHITGYLAGESFGSTRATLILLTLWQIVPLIRGTNLAPALEAEASGVIITVTATFILYWLLSIISATRAIMKKDYV